MARYEAVFASITPEQVVTALRELWVGDAPLIFVSTSLELSEDEVLDAWRTSKKIAVIAPEQHQTQTFAYTDFGPSGKIVWQDYIEDFDITRVRFANNVMVNFKPTKLENGRVRIGLRIGAGQAFQPVEQPGLITLANSALTAGGLNAHTVDDLARIIAGRTVRVGLGVGPNALGGSVSTKPDDFELQLQIWMAYLNDAAWRKAPVARFYKSLDTIYEMKDATPASVSSWNVPQLVHDGDNRWGWPAKQALAALEIDAAKDWAQEIMGAASIEISVVGDIEQEAALSAIAATFGTLPKREAKPRAKDGGRTIRFPTGRGPKPLFHNGKSDQAKALVYWPTTDNKDIILTRQAALAKAVLGLKITERVREQEGASYSPSAFWSMSGSFSGYGYMGVNMDLEPEKLPKFFDIADELVAELVAGKISKDELLRARNPILERFETDIESNGYWASLLSVAQTDPKWMQYARTRRQQYEAITAADLQEFAARYLLPERAYRISILPKGASEE